jgi:hypothetical protein
VPSRNNELVRTLARAEQFGLAFTSLGVPGEQLTFGIHDQLALVPARLLQRLPEVARQRHVAADLPALRSPQPAVSGAAERTAAVARTSTPDPVPAKPQRAAHAVPPIARLEAHTSASTPLPELSL